METQRYRLDLAYDGTGFHGWAKQPDLRTVQGVLEQALGLLTGGTMPAPQPASVTVPVTVAGRTDAGVHARGQVVHFDVTPDAQIKLAGRSAAPVAEALVRRLNRVLPDDLRVLAAAAVPQGFDARFSARWRRYCYRLVDQVAAVDPLRRGYEWLAPGALDVPAMAAAADELLGEHDFEAFCRPREGASTVRTLQVLAPKRVSPGRVELWVQADAFCHNMVRCLAGALVQVGLGRRSADWPAQVLAAKQRDPAAGVLPAHGLTLEQVAYPPSEDLASQAKAARVFRG